MARGVALLLALTGSGLAVVVSAVPAQAAITAPFISVFSTNISGNILIRGNTVSTCQNSATSCATGRAASTLNNNAFFMTYVDADVDATTFDSSSTTVDVPAGGSVLFAALTWGGNTTAGASLNDPAFGIGTGVGAPSAASAGQVRLKAPGAAVYSTVTSTRTSFLAGSTGPYQGYADVTAAVQGAGNGSYTVANVQTATGTNIHGGWALTVAYAKATDPPRNLTVFSGFGSVAATNVVDVPVSGFQTPTSGTVKTTLGAVSYEGDAGSTGDQMQLGNATGSLRNVTDALHPAGNSFISVLSDNGVDSSTRSPKYKNQLGFDAATVNVDGFLTNASSAAVIRLTSAAGGETYYPGVLTFATDLYTPTINATKTVAVAVKASGNTQSGVAEPGDTLQYTVNATNNGQDASVGTVFNDTMPTGTTYVPGTLTSGGVALTDAAGDDIGSYTGATSKVKVNVGTGATPTAGGRLDVGASIAPVTFRVVIDSGAPDGTTIQNTASFSYSGEDTGVAVSGASNAVTTPVVPHQSALSITKTANVAVVQRGSATPVTYTLTVANAGPYDDPSVTVTDALPAGAVLVSATASAGSCTTPPGQVVCNLGALPNGVTRTVTVTVTLDAAADPATDQATASGANEDADPTDSTATRSTAVNRSPTAAADTASTAGGTATIAVLANDTDPDSDALSVTPGAIAPTKGSIVVNADGTVTYTATAGALGIDSFSYDISDGRGGTSTAVVTVTIPNAPPVANADSATAAPGQAVTVNVLANDTDPNIPTSSQALTVSAITQPAAGKGVVTTNGSTVLFTPSPAFRSGSATCTYTLSDGAGGTDTASVTVTVPNVGPVTAPDSATTPYGTAVTVDVLLNDSDDNGDALTVTAVSAPSSGTAVITGTGSATKIRYTPAVGWSGPVTMTYTISDGTTTRTGTLTVTTGNAAPTAADFSATVDGLVATTIDVLAHAGDPNGDPLTLVGAVGAAHGSVGVDADGNVVYTPDPAYVGPDSFTYTVSDGQDTATATVTLTVRNQSPQASDDAMLVPLNGSVDVPVLANDTDGNADALSITGVTTPAHGTATVRPDGTVRYVPDAGYLGDDSFAYTVVDGRGGSDTATVTVTVANQPPVAVADSAVATGNAGSPVTIDVLANDSDPNGDPLTIDSVSNAAHGTATIVAGAIVYTPSATFTGTDTFTYWISDGRGALSGAVVTVDVQNRNPVAGADTAVASTGMPVDVDVLANDTDADSETLSVLSADTASARGGTVSVVGGVLRYVSATGFTGTDSFSYVVTDPRGGTDTATVTVTVSNANPISTNRTVTTATDTAVAVDLLAGATDADGQAVTVTTVGPATHGTVSIDASGVATYAPAPGYSGPDAFSYTVSDGQGGFSTATVTLTVTDADPVAVADTTSVGYDVPVTVDVLANDSDPNIPGTGQQLSVSSAVVTTGSGTATVEPDGRVTVDPDAGFAGDIVVSYVVSDGAGGTATGQLTVHVAVPSAVAVDDVATTTVDTPVDVDVLANDSSGQVGVAPALVAGSVTDPVDFDGQTQGTVSVVSGLLHYVAPAGYAGTVTFAYTIRNPLGGTDSATVTLTVGNAEPVATPDSTSTAYDTDVTVDVLANDTDANIPGTAQVLTASSFVVVSGAATLSTSGAGSVTVDPAADFAGDVVVSYLLSDGAGGTDTATLTVTVALPVATALGDTATTPYDTPVTVDVLANDDSGQGGAAPVLVAGSLTSPVDADGVVRGTVTIVGTRVAYVPPASFSGTVTFDYTMANPLGGTDTANVSIAVGNASPVATDDTADTAYDTTATVDVRANDTDANIPGTAQTLAVTTVTLRSGSATVVVLTDGNVRVDPDADFAGDVVVDYVVSDDAGGSDAGVLTVHVALPVAHAVADSASTDPGVPVTVDVLANDDSGQAGALPTIVGGSVTAPEDSAGGVRGSVSIVAGGLSYVPPSGFSGVVTFRYTMRNPLGGTDVATVTIAVGNVAPTAADDIAATTYATPVTVDVLANDDDPNIPGSDQVLAVTSATVLSGQATVTVHPDGTVTVDPADGFAGDVVVDCAISDGAGGTDTGRLTVHVAPPTPTAVDDSAVTPYLTPVLVPVLANDASGQAGAGLAVLAGSVTAPLDGAGATRGDVTVVGGTLRYTPSGGFSGTVSFAYAATNPLGGTAFATVTVTVANASPVAVDDAATTTYVTAVSVSVLDNDGDPNIPVTDQTLAVSGVHLVSGSAGVTQEADQVHVTPLAGFAGVVVVAYTVADGAGGTALGVLRTTVVPPAPTAVDDSASTSFGHAVTVDVLANDSSGLVGAAPTIVAGSVPPPVDDAGNRVGSVSVAGGRLHYVPAAGFVGVASTHYTITNPLGGTAAGQVRITVLPRTVEALTDDISIEADQHAVSLDPADRVLGHGDLRIVSVTQPAGGATVQIVGGRLIVTRAPGFVGTVTFSYIVVGADGAFVTVTVTVHVLAAAPAASGAGGTPSTSGSGLPRTGSGLPRTGADVAALGLAGMLLVGLGTAAIRLGRSRRDAISGR